MKPKIKLIKSHGLCESEKDFFFFLKAADVSMGHSWKEKQDGLRNNE